MSKRDVPPAKPKPSPATRQRRYRGVDAGERITERRKQFIDAGVECFGTRGYHPVTVRELCQQARLTERYFYESFQDREALFAAVYEHLIGELRAAFLAAAGPLAPDLRAMARAGLDVYFHSLQKDARVARITMLDVLTVSADMERRALRATYAFAELIKQMTLAALPRKHPSPSIDMDLIATGLIGSVVHIAMRWLADGYHQPARTVIDTAMTFFEATIRQLGATAPDAS